MEEEYLTQKELCKRLKITSMTAYRYRQAGMPYLGQNRGIRYKISEVDEWLRQRSKQKG